MVLTENNEAVPNSEKIHLYANSSEIIKKYFFIHTRSLFFRLQECQIESTKEIRTLSYRILEYLLPETSYQDIFQVYHWDVFLSRFAFQNFLMLALCRTLISDARYDMERQQALSLLFKYLERPEGSFFLYLISKDLLRFLFHWFEFLSVWRNN